jgi:hypothetical protein
MNYFLNFILLDISVTCRALYFNAARDELINESFQYVIREYYVIIWAFLFKNDYAFKVFHQNMNSKILFFVPYI